MKKRLFMSIPISNALKEAFASYETWYPFKGTRWIPRESLHITVYFIGERDGEEVPALIKMLEGVARHIKPFRLEFVDVQYAPPGKTKRMVWGNFEKSPLFQELMDKVSKAMDPSYDLGVERAALPHVTLARIKDWRRFRQVALRQPEIKDKAIRVTVMELRESRLTPTGSVYSVLETFPLRGDVG